MYSIITYSIININDNIDDVKHEKYKYYLAYLDAAFLALASLANS